MSDLFKLIMVIERVLTIFLDNSANGVCRNFEDIFDKVWFKVIYASLGYEPFDLRTFFIPEGEASSQASSVWI